MKNFVQKIALFALLPIIWFCTNMVINRYLYLQQKVDLTKDSSVFIAGDSHPQRGINPEYFKHAENIAQSAEPYVLTYWKLKKIFQTHVPDTLILGFSPHNISAYNDLKFSDDNWAPEVFRRSYPILNLDNIEGKIPINYFTYSRVIWDNTAYFPKEDHINYMGQFAKGEASKPNDWERVIKRQFYDEDKSLGVSELSVQYLDSIVHLCTTKNIEIVLVSTPVHTTYFENIPPPMMERYSDLCQHYATRHLVFNRMNKEYPDSLFFNSNHLNTLGANTFTQELIEELKVKPL